MPVTLAPISRRGFIAASLATGLGAMLSGGCSRPTQAKRDPNHLALLSDIHIHANPEKLDRNVNLTHHLRAAVAEIMALQTAEMCASTIVVTGDCAHRIGEPEDYAQMLSLLTPLIKAKLPIHMAFGNHDNRESFWHAVAYEAISPNARVKALAERHVLKFPTPAADVIMLDSLDKINETPGLLGEDQLKWLKQTLDTPGDKPVVVMVHHQPRPNPVTAIAPASPPATLPGTEPSSRPAALIAPAASSAHTTTTSQPATKPFGGLADGQLLLDLLLPRKRVKALMFGHTHVWTHYTIEGLHCVNLPAVAYTFAPTEPSAWTDCHLSHNSMRLEIHCIDRTHAKHGDVAELKWRT